MLKALEDAAQLLWERFIRPQTPVEGSNLLLAAGLYVSEELHREKSYEMFPLTCKPLTPYPPYESKGYNS